jgi:hypothetical protein
MAIKLVHNVETGEVSEVELTATELAQQAEDIKQSKIDKAASESNIAAKAALLERLGMTADEAALLLG